MMKGEQLPAGWELRASRSQQGKSYFFHPASNTIQWQHPGLLPLDRDTLVVRRHYNAVAAKEEAASGGCGGVAVTTAASSSSTACQPKPNKLVEASRKLHNLLKSVLLSAVLGPDGIHPSQAHLAVLDLGCGKGGDLVKMTKLPRVTHYVGVDLSETCVEVAHKRLALMRERHPDLTLQHVHYIHADFTSDPVAGAVAERLQGLKEPQRSRAAADVVMSMFAAHYAFHSQAGAAQFMTNVAACMRPDGLALLIVPDGDELLRRASTNPWGSDHGGGATLQSFGSPLYNVKWCAAAAPTAPTHPRSDPGLSPALSYLFTYPGCVEACPEPLVTLQAWKHAAAAAGLVVTAAESLLPVEARALVMSGVSHTHSATGMIAAMKPHLADTIRQLWSSLDMSRLLSEAAAAATATPADDTSVSSDGYNSQPAAKRQKTLDGGGGAATAPTPPAPTPTARNHLSDAVGLYRVLILRHAGGNASAESAGGDAIAHRPIQNLVALLGQAETTQPASNNSVKVSERPPPELLHLLPGVEVSRLFG